MTTDIDMSTDEALISALSPKRLGELELQPFSLMRQVIATRLCRADDNFFNAVFASPELFKCPEDIVQFRVRRVKCNAIDVSAVGLHIDLQCRI